MIRKRTLTAEEADAHGEIGGTGRAEADLEENREEGEGEWRAS